MEEKLSKKSGRHWYGKRGFKRGLLVFVSDNTHLKLKRLAKRKGITLQEFVRGVLERTAGK